MEAFIIPAQAKQAGSFKRRVMGAVMKGSWAGFLWS